jgi:hypothetical protein
MKSTQNIFQRHTVRVQLMRDKLPHQPFLIKNPKDVFDLFKEKLAVMTSMRFKRHGNDMSGSPRPFTDLKIRGR